MVLFWLFVGVMLTVVYSLGFLLRFLWDFKFDPWIIRNLKWLWDFREFWRYVIGGIDSDYISPGQLWP